MKGMVVRGVLTVFLYLVFCLINQAINIGQRPFKVEYS
jgi:hypothetical protein